MNLTSTIEQFLEEKKIKTDYKNKTFKYANVQIATLDGDEYTFKDNALTERSFKKFLEKSIDLEFFLDKIEAEEQEEERDAGITGQLEFIYNPKGERAIKVLIEFVSKDLKELEIVSFKKDGKEENRSSRRSRIRRIKNTEQLANYSIRYVRKELPD